MVMDDVLTPVQDWFFIVMANEVDVCALIYLNRLVNFL